MRAFGRAAAVVAVVIAAYATLLAVDARMWPAPTADHACPAPGTMFTMSMPLALSAQPVFRNRVTIIGSDGLNCRIRSEASGVYWMHAGLVNDSVRAEMRAAAEKMWPLKVGNTARADYRYGGRQWIVHFRVAAYEKVATRAGAYEAFKIVETAEADGAFISETTRWWAPALRYTVSYRRSPDNYNFEIAAIDSR